MKKNILSLVAFMAFSVSAFANTIEVKEEVVVVEEKVEVVMKNKIEVITVVDCYEFAADMESIFAPGGGDWGYEVFAYSYETCVAGGFCHNCLSGLTHWTFKK